MTPDNHKCFACGGSISLSDSKSGICANPDCNGLGLFSICGFCKEISFAYHAKRMHCYNSDCRMHGVERQICPTCNKASMITYKSEDICINRGCGSNREKVATCFFCGHISFLSTREVSFCTKGDCRMLLREVQLCFFCGEETHDIDSKCCENPE
ncbi:MAG: hypothetical protein ACYS8W_21010 [Planctomycetota bacterium]|jgi:hypothetical protein